MKIEEQFLAKSHPENSVHPVLTRRPKVRLGEVLRLNLDRVVVDASISYPMVGVLSFGRGLFEREPIENGKTSYKHFYRLKAEHVVMSQLFGWEGALALSSERFEGKFLSPQFPTFVCDAGRLDRSFLGWLMRRPAFWEDLGSRASGMGDRRRTLTPEALFACEIPLPPLAEQWRVVARIEELAAQINGARALRQQAADEAEALTRANLNSLFGNFYRGTSGHLTVSRWSRLEDVVTDVADGPHVTPTYVPDGIPFISLC
jgi:type I restriction enzyme S subunit